MAFPNEFTVRLFSKDSITQFPTNTLSNFTVQLQNKLPLDPNYKYEVGLMELILPPAESSRFIQTDSRDMINFAHKENKTLDIKELAKYILAHSSHPEIYFNNHYFEKYLNKSFFFDPLSLRRHFGEDDVTLDGDELHEMLTIKFEVNSLIHADETVDSFVAAHKRFANKTGFTTVNLELPTRKALTMKQILYKMIEIMIKQLRHGNSSISKHINEFLTDQTLNSLTLDQKVEAMRRHLDSVNTLVKRFIAEFVNNVVKEKLNHVRIETPASRLCLVYTDIISQQFTSDVNTRCLYILPYEAKARASFHHEKCQVIQYAQVEKNDISSITITLNDEQSQQINFLPNIHSTYVNLHFRKIMS